MLTFCEHNETIKMILSVSDDKMVLLHDGSQVHESKVRRMSSVTNDINRAIGMIPEILAFSTDHKVEIVENRLLIDDKVCGLMGKNIVLSTLVTLAHHVNKRSYFSEYTGIEAVECSEMIGEAIFKAYRSQYRSVGYDPLFLWKLCKALVILEPLQMN